MERTGEAEMKTQRKLRAAIAGCGGIAQVHAKALGSMPDVTLAACADILPDRAEALAKTGGCRAYTDVEDMLRKEKPDVLHICTPHYLHTPMTRLAADLGIAVFTEKPPVISREQWADFTQAGQKVPVGICFQNRYNRSVRHLLGLVRSGKTGAVMGARAIVTWSRDARYYTESGWRGKLATEGGGVLINQSIHTLDLLVCFLGEASFAEATASNRHLKNVIEVEDTLDAYIGFPSCCAVFYATNAYNGNAPVLLELSCENGTYRMEDNELLCRSNDGTKERIVFDKPDVLGKGYWGNGHLACIRDFYDSLETDSAVPIGIPQAADTVNLMLGIYESARTNQRIALS